MISQNTHLIDLMKKGWVSPLLALSEVKCFRLASRVHDIKALGYEVIDRWSENHEYKEYRIKEESK